jgi:hypothetical protein
MAGWHQATRSDTAVRSGISGMGAGVGDEPPRLQVRRDGGCACVLHPQCSERRFRRWCRSSESNGPTAYKALKVSRPVAFGAPRRANQGVAFRWAPVAFARGRAGRAGTQCVKFGAECPNRTDDLPLTVPLRLSPPLVRGLDYPLAVACSHAIGSPRLVSTPSRFRRLGSGLALPVRALAFPEFEGFYSRRFRTGHSYRFKAVALPTELTRHRERKSIPAGPLVDPQRCPPPPQQVPPKMNAT